MNALTAYSNDKSLIPPRIVTTTKLATHLFMPALGDSTGFKALAGSSEGFKGVTMILNPANGEVIGLLNAKSLTAFRTALASSLPLSNFFRTMEGSDNQCISFGSGLQSYWHIKLCLLLYAGSITSVVLANRSIPNLQKMIDELAEEFPDVGFKIVLFGSEECAQEVDKSCVLFGCTPSTEPVMYHKWLKSERRRFVSLIGSYKPQMMEIDGSFVTAALESSGKIIVDSVADVAVEAGEIIQNNVPDEKLLPIAEASKDDDVYKGDLLFSKIVGLSIMDISVGAEILSMCDKKNIGIVIDDF